MIVPYRDPLQMIPAQYRGAVNTAITAGQTMQAIGNSQWYRTLSKAARGAVKSYYRRSSPQIPSQMPEPAPVALNTRVRKAPVKFRGTMTGSNIIKHREYIGDIAGSTSFAATAFIAQPALNNSFPWLSTLAASYEQYRFRKLTYVYCNIAATSERGRVTLGFDPDVLDETPTNKVDLFQFSQCQEGAVWSGLKLDVKCPEKKFTRVGPVSTGDLKTYDAGKLVVGVSSTATTDTIGELFVEYEVELITPQPSKCPGSKVINLGVTNSISWFSVGQTIEGNLNIEDTPNGIKFNSVGAYIVSYHITGTVATGAMSTGASTIIPSDHRYTAGTTTTGHIYIKVTAPGQLLYLTSTGTPTDSDITTYIGHCNL